MIAKETGLVWRLVAAFVLLGCGSAPMAWAQETPAPAGARPEGTPAASDKPGGREAAVPLFNEGKDLFDKGYYLQAIEKFKLALFHFPNPRIHTRIGLCYKWLGNNLKALESYELYLQQVPASTTNPDDQALRKQVEVDVAVLLKLVRQLRGTITEPAGAEVRVNGALAGLAPMDKVIRLSPGEANVTVMAKGYYTFRKDVNLLNELSALVKVTLLKIQPKVITVRVHGKPIYRRWWFWTVVGVAVAGTAAGLLAKYGITYKPRDLVGTPVNSDGFAVRW
jgi:hypothetical protein